MDGETPTPTEVLIPQVISEWISQLRDFPERFSPKWQEVRALEIKGWNRSPSENEELERWRKIADEARLKENLPVVVTYLMANPLPKDGPKTAPYSEQYLILDGRRPEGLEDQLRDAIREGNLDALFVGVALVNQKMREEFQKLERGKSEEVKREPVPEVITDQREIEEFIGKRNVYVGERNRIMDVSHNGSTALDAMRQMFGIHAPYPNWEAVLRSPRRLPIRHPA